MGGASDYGELRLTPGWTPRRHRRSSIILRRKDLRLRIGQRRAPEQSLQAMKDGSFALLPCEPVRSHETLDKDATNSQNEE
jgi:hypothetical protein